jgi:endonuclease-3
MKIPHTDNILQLLKRRYPKSHIELTYTSPWELLVAVILSAQCTDKRVNIVTKKLFLKYKTIKAYATADISEFEQDIRSTGFFRNKAKNIIRTAQLILEKYNGKVPDSMKNLLTLHGVARKTANIVLGNVYKKVEGIAVDTHVMRLSQRLGFTENANPEKIEQDLMKLIEKEEWSKISYRLIDHGRAICNAKKPMCDKCFLNKLCPSAFLFPHFKK